MGFRGPYGAKEKRRQCLKCQGWFWSSGIENRLCGACNAANAGQRDCPTAAPKWNGDPMWVRARREDCDAEGMVIR